MFGSGKKKNAAKKAYEIAYALFRISAKISESGLKERLESQAMDLLISANAEEYGNAAKAVAAIDALVKFAADLNIISISNSDVLLREIAIMNEAIIECLDKSDDVDVSKFFSAETEEKKENVTLDSFIDSANPAETVLSHAYSFVPAETMSPRVPSAVPVSTGIQTSQPPFIMGQREEKKESGNGQSGSSASVLRSGNRQIAILDRIRQSGNCKLREIQEVLPDCSERTIRYDLEDLIERNLVERVGAGGPAVSYRIRQIV